MAGNTFWIFPMGSRVGLTRTEFPTPCYFEDIRQLVNRERVKAVLIILDSDEADLKRFWGMWNGIISATQVTILCSENEKCLVERLVNTSNSESTYIKIFEKDEECVYSNDFFAALQALLPQDIILSSNPYDSYGEYIKADLENALLPFLKKWEAVFLLHDPQFQVVRVADFKILKDRVFWRPWRISIYVHVVRTVCWISSMLFRNIDEGWTRVK